MKVLLVNGSPHKEGCTYTALCEAFFINCKHIALKMGISLPKKEEFVFTNFIAKDEY